MANYYQTVPDNHQVADAEEDGSSWLLNPLSQGTMPEQVDETLLMWNDMGRLHNFPK